MAGRRNIAPLATSELTLAEVLVASLADRDAALAATYETSLMSNATWSVLPIDRAILRQAARLRAAHKVLKLPDAIHLASATKARCSHFLASDLSLLRLIETGDFEAPHLAALRPTEAVLPEIVQSLRP
jgi:predicted nucleic acid-binding protein